MNSNLTPVAHSLTQPHATEPAPGELIPDEAGGIFTDFRT